MEENRKVPVSIEITGVHDTFDGDTKTSEKYEGIFSKRADSVYLIYVDKDGLRNMIKVTRDKIELKKILAARCHGEKNDRNQEMASLMYGLKTSTSGFYRTPYGTLDTEIFTDELIKEESSHKFSFYVRGKLKMNGSPVSDFVLNLRAAVIN